MASPQLDITILKPAEAGELLTLRRAAFAEAIADGGPAARAMLQPLDAIEEELANERNTVLGGRRGGRLVASIRIDVQPPTAALSMFAVAPDLRHQGIGTELVRAVPERLPGTVKEVRVVPLPGQGEDRAALAALGAQPASDEGLASLASAYLRRIGEL